ncbi:VOC family protein [Streptosporangiaceae bacterium NEAU-GS5]|nr:VOC family protein [Streptosporangiaceae bacterium NEAU-GS5]
MDWKLELVMIPVSDVDRAKHFYSEQVGFAVDHDTAFNEQTRFVQLTPPGSACSIAISSGAASGAPGSVQGVQLVVDDLDQARETLVKGGVEVSEIRHFDEDGVQRPGRGDPWNAFIFFSDPDGNGWTLQERPSDAS